MKAEKINSYKNMEKKLVQSNRICCKTVSKFIHYLEESSFHNFKNLWVQIHVKINI